MTGAGDISRLLAEIVTAADETHIIDLLADSLDALATLPPIERERANMRIQDAIREYRDVNDGYRRRLKERLVRSARRKRNSRVP
jgi:hypothetical protein